MKPPCWLLQLHAVTVTVICSGLLL